MRVGGLTSYDWDVIKQYIQLLEPLQQATLKLKGRGKAGRNGAIWEVIPCMEFLIRHYEEAKARLTEATTEDYPDQDAIKDHYEINVNRGWAKLQKYYTALNQTPIYYAACLLHPNLKRFCQNNWKERPDWITSCDTSFQEL